MNTIIVIALIFVPGLILLSSLVSLAKRGETTARLNAKYRRDQNLEEERRTCVNFVVNHGISIDHTEPYAILSKKMDGHSVVADEMMLKSRRIALAYARKRIREIGVELGDNPYLMYTRETT